MVLLNSQVQSSCYITKHQFIFQIFFPLILYSCNSFQCSHVFVGILIYSILFTMETLIVVVVFKLQLIISLICRRIYYIRTVVLQLPHQLSSPEFPLQDTRCTVHIQLVVSFQQVLCQHIVTHHGKFKPSMACWSTQILLAKFSVLPLSRIVTLPIC